MDAHNPKALTIVGEDGLDVVVCIEGLVPRSPAERDR